MRVFVTGAAGALGRLLVPGLGAAGREVTAAARMPGGPVPVVEWLPYLARVAGPEPPLRVPAWLGRLLAGEFAVAQMTSARGSSNERAGKGLGWKPRYASWREGFGAWVTG